MLTRVAAGGQNGTFVLLFDPNGFGVTGDWEAYSLGGTQLYFYIFNVAIIASDFLMYLIVFLMICKMRNGRVHVLALVTTDHDSYGDYANIHQPQASNSVNATRNVEKTLLIACFITWAFEVLGKLILIYFLHLLVFLAPTNVHIKNYQYAISRS
uniref:Uncharacterized protein n=1 Tax=Parascaris equorum TaxID=6256 RepID=A0A914RJX6_PAREQ